MLTLVAGALFLRARLGRVTGWTTGCRHCGFELRGLNPTTRVCPECGQHLGAKADILPSTRQSNPLHWISAIVVATLGLGMIWLGQPGRLLQTGRSFCSILPDRQLVAVFPWVPQIAGAPLEARIDAQRLPTTMLDDVVDMLANDVRQHPRQPLRETGKILSSLRTAYTLDSEQVARLLSGCLHGVQLIAGSPRPVKPGGVFVATAVLPATPVLSWITHHEIRLAILSVKATLSDGSVVPLERVPSGFDESPPSREFDGTVFRAPATPGTIDCVMSVSLQQPGSDPGLFQEGATKDFVLQVLDPSSIQIQFKTDAAVAAMARSWLAVSTCTIDEPTQRITVSLPGDLRPLMRAKVAIASRVKLVQGELSLDVGRIWIDEFVPTIALTPSAIPAALDRTKPAWIVVEPDAEYAMIMASSSRNALADRVEVPIHLPPPPNPSSVPPPGQIPTP